jgi:SAM-dependent methyltransferase
MSNIKSSISCICCGTPATYYFTKINEHGEYPVLKCRECKTAFVWPRPDENEMLCYYSDRKYSNSAHENVIESGTLYYPNSRSDAQRIISRCSELSDGKRFLDVGAGFGVFSKVALESGYKVCACEPNPNAREVYKSQNGFEPLSCMFDQKYADENRQKFDVVLLSQVLEHVGAPAEAVKHIDSVLDVNGIVAIAVPHFGSVLSILQGRKDMFISPPEHVNYFSIRGLKVLFEKHDFRLELVETVSKVNCGRIRNAFRIPIMADAVWMFLYGTLKTFELIDRGMIINAYFRKYGQAQYE